MRLVAVPILALVFAVTRPLAAAETGLLAPGKPAGLSEAQMNNHQLFIYITIGGSVATLAAGLLLMKKTSAAGTANAAPASAVSVAGTTAS
jgi:hypothetical protein